MRNNCTTDYRLTQAGILRALSLPGFFLSTRRGSRVMQPAERRKVSKRKKVPVSAEDKLTSPQRRLQVGLMCQQRPRQTQRNGFGLACCASTRRHRPNIVLVQPLRRLERPDCRLTVV